MHRLLFAFCALVLLIAGCADDSGSSGNQPCTDSAECNGDFCNASGQCVAYGGTGDNCAADSPCGPGLTCSASGVCEATACANRSECDGLACIAGVCADAGAGENCASDDECSTPLYCDPTDGICLAPISMTDDADMDGYIAISAGGNDCNDNDAQINPDAMEICGDNIDQDCDGLDMVCPIDVDMDGHSPISEGGGDCDDNDPDINPDAFDRCEDMIDQDCMGGDNVCVDGDMDGYPDRNFGGNDCNDADPNISPAAEEICGDMIDQDCDDMDNVCPTQVCEFRPPTGNLTPTPEFHWFGPGMGRNPADHVHACTTPVVVNLTDDNMNGVIDQDDVPTIIFPTYRGTAYTTNGVIRAVRGDTGVEVWNTKGNNNRRADATSNLAAGDIDGDGWPEILAQHEDKRLMAFDTDGTPLWKATQGVAPTSASPAIADLDRDGTPEIVFGRHVYDNLGNRLARGDGASEGSNSAFSIPCVADLDGNGNMEIVTGQIAYGFVDDGMGTITMPRFWPADAARDALGDGFCAVADLDEDGGPEVIHVRQGTVTIIDGPTGTLEGTVYIPDITVSDDGRSGAQGRCGAPTIGDFDNDTHPEIGMACRWSYVVLEVGANMNGTYTLTRLWEQPTEDDSSNATGSSVFDFEGDGQAEVVYNDEEFLRVYDGATGAVLVEVPNSSRTRSENPVIADVDNDGNAEIVVSSSNDTAFPHDTNIALRHGITVYGDQNDFWVSTRKIWNQHAYHITNVNDDGTIPANEASNWLTFNNYRANEGDGVFDAPDLLIEIVDIDTRFCPDDMVIALRVTNNGQQRVGPGLPIRVTITDAMGTVLVDVVVLTTKGLPPGASQRVEVTASGPFPLENVDIRAAVDEQLDGTGTQNECNEDNNTATASILCGQVN